jgi:O6-methylguanine-DNA--protein-cysteine methyltransferase
MEDSSFFREQAERCRRQASDSADPMLQITFGTLADDCTAYADELEDQELDANYPDEAWIPIKPQTETWSAIRTILFGMLLTTPGTFAVAWMLWAAS